ncbi:unnamed protein product [Gadus morhua 'NCC']
MTITLPSSRPLSQRTRKSLAGWLAPVSNQTTQMRDQVQTEMGGTSQFPTWAELECHSMCDLGGDPRYTWFRNGQNEGSSVTLSCSSDANPAANYTWFKNNQPLLWEPPHTFPSVRPEDRGTYRCHAENKYGHLSSNSIFLNVTYAPKTPSVTVSPSGEIEEGSSVTLSCSSDANPAAEYTWLKIHEDSEGSSVTLSCSSDANPAAEYTWFKNNQPLLWGPRQPHTFPSVRPEDRGTYRCQAENKYGQLSSNLLFMDVQYAPKTPSVTVSPSGEIEEGSSVTLSCSSDANPAAEYTWFKEHEDSKKEGLQKSMWTGRKARYCGGGETKEAIYY